MTDLIWFFGLTAVIPDIDEAINLIDPVGKNNDIEVVSVKV